MGTSLVLLYPKLLIKIISQIYIFVNINLDHHLFLQFYPEKLSFLAHFWAEVLAMLPARKVFGKMAMFVAVLNFVDFARLAYALAFFLI